MKKGMLKKVMAGMVAATVAAAAPMSTSAAWVKNGGAWQWTENGTPVTGWRWISGDTAWYHFNGSGDMTTGWLQDGGNWYYLKASGAMASFWNEINGKWYFMNPSGAMQYGWIMAKGLWYFLGPDGAMVTGVVQIDGKTYYFGPDGAMRTGRVEIGGKHYTFNSEGKAVGTGPKAEKAYKTTQKAPVEVAVTTPTVRPSTGGGTTKPEEPTPADPSVATVTDAETLTAALNNPEVKTIKLDADITLDAPLTLTKDLDGGGNTLTVNVTDTSAVVVSEDGVTVKNVTVDAGLDDPSAWSSVYAIQVYDATGVTLDGVTATGANTGILVNGSEVTLTGDVDVSGNGFGGIEVSTGAAAGLAESKLTATDANITNSSEAANNPTIYIDGSGTVDSNLTQGTAPTGKTYYFIDSENATTANVASVNDLKEALNDDSIEEIKLTSDVELTEPLTVTKDLDGNGQEISGKPIYASGEDVTISNVVFAAPTNNSDNASNIYAHDLTGTLTIQDCVFESTQYEYIQITPTGNAKIYIIDNTFSPNATKRYLHIEAGRNDNNSVQVTITGNSFGTAADLADSMIDVDYIDLDNVTANNNTFADSQNSFETATTSLIYLCDNSGKKLLTNTEAYTFFTTGEKPSSEESSSTSSDTSSEESSSTSSDTSSEESSSTSSDTSSEESSSTSSGTSSEESSSTSSDTSSEESSSVSA